MLLLLSSVYGVISHGITKKTLKLDCFLAKVWYSRHIKYVSPLYSRIYFLKLCKNKNLWWSFKAAADAADKGKLYSTCSTPELLERNFCDGAEIKFTSPLGWIHQAGAP